MRTADPAPFTLRRATGDHAAGADALERELRRAGLEAVLAGANRRAARRPATKAFAGMKPKPADWYTFDPADDDTADWYPQGVTCASDGGFATPAFAVSWYWRPPSGERGARVSFLDTASLRYRHVLLVEVRPDGSFGPVPVHAGGIVWYAGRLYVADTENGLRVFDLARFLDMRTGRDDVGDPEKIGFHDGRAHAFGYRYVLPQTDSWQVDPGSARFSYVTLDRSGERDLLLSGEYTDDPGETGRVARWALDGETLAETGGEAEPVDAYTAPDAGIQGALSHAGRWYFSRGRGASANGSLIVTAPEGEPVSRSYPIGPEDLTCWREQGTLWSVTEFRGRRALFAVPL
ncbi:hypothetical protein [Spongiactinospora sp. TRM90649]|uniref:hypothetical protein n=1 Tax=Spongiactinospora sp. TRM90649 TaxID=3031114 RepID=UPI0023F8682A|nr:hypothetical protein [Spongiactinospora sp. TRM90649]MDF5752279.1 hypothetical protein [Spongiactinospora sp. TRM90649]